MQFGCHSPCPQNVLFKTQIKKFHKTYDPVSHESMLFTNIPLLLFCGKECKREISFPTVFEAF